MGVSPGEFSDVDIDDSYDGFEVDDGFEVNVGFEVEVVVSVDDNLDVDAQDNDN